MASDTVDRDVVRSFWEQKSQDERNRWTSEATLAHELSYLRRLASAPRSILDLGSGHGELSRPLAAAGVRLVAVDFAAAYARSFTASGHEFVESGLDVFQTDESFDLVLLFGVVTYLDEVDEVPLFHRMSRWLARDGVVVVKHQCSTGAGFVKTGKSEALGMDYSARYPAVAAQVVRLREVFASVEQHPYPAQLNTWNTSAHIAFACRATPA